MSKSIGMHFRCLIDYCTVFVIGIPLGLFFTILLACGRIQIKGYRRALRFIKHGNVIIATNHPSMLETILIPLLFFPFYLISLRFFVWSVPDRKLLPPYFRWLFWIARCATVDRGNRSYNVHALKKLSLILQKKGIIVIHPEAGRTHKGMQFLSHNDRRIRILTSNISSLARSTQATIIPLWVSGTDIVLPAGYVRPRFMRSKIILSFGNPYRPLIKKQTASEESAILAQAILTS